MRLGKLTSRELNENVLSLLSVGRREVVLGAATGEDCAALELPGTILVSSDPITSEVDPVKAGALCVDVCCNDISACGGEPVAMTITLIMPPASDASDVRVIMQGAARRARELNVSIVGGHTEFSDAVTRPIISGTALGKAARLLKKSDLKAGDRLFVTKKLALEGTCILADMDKGDFTPGERRKLTEFASMLGVTAEAKEFALLPCVDAMHDVTEGGVLGAVAEICTSNGLGAVLYERDMPVDELTEKVCRRAGVDPLGLISSGSMLVASSDPGAVKKAARRAGVEITQIGHITSDGVVRLVRRDGTERTVEVAPDELCKIAGERKK